jgi:acyl dehydratase
VGTVREGSFTVDLVVNLTRGQIVQYAGASGDFNPLHTDEIYATRVAGFPSVFAHGMLTMGLTGKALTDRFGVGSLRSFGGRFRSQVWPGDSLRVAITVGNASADGTVMLTFTTLNQHDVSVFEGSATVLEPGRTNDTATDV